MHPTTSNNDFKQQFRHVYNLAKQFDQQKKCITKISDIFSPSIETIRLELVDAATALIYQTEYEAFAKKSREILWFKGYYDLISLAKRFWKRNGEANDPLLEMQVSNLIIEGIANFKMIVVRMEHDHDLDLRHTVNFSFLDTFEKNILLSTTSAIKYNGIANGNGDMNGDGGSSGGSEHDLQRRDSTETNRYALDTVHALLISLGDMHRYFIDFNFSMPKISKDFASNYYFEAFKLNPKIGMAHNQLGTLFSGQNYELDAVYHYLYSLVCAVPFDLSEVNVTKLFQSNADYLGRSGQNDKFDEIVVRDAIARFILVADVFFNEKDDVDLNALCHCTLIDARELLKSRQADGMSDIFFKMIAILFFCLAKLKMAGSPKVHHLNAFLLAICAEIVSACTTKLRSFLDKKQKQIGLFVVEYGEAFNEFESSVRIARDNHKRSAGEKKLANGLEKPVNGVKQTMQNGDAKPEVVGKLINHRSDGSQRETDGHVGGSSSGQARSGGSELKSTSQKVSKKKQLKVRRRRKRFSPDDSDSEQSDSDYDMNSDFSTDTESDEFDDDDLNSCYSTDYDEDKEVPRTNGKQSDDDDIVIEEEELVYLNGNGVSDHVQSADNFKFSDDLCNGFNSALNFACTDPTEETPNPIAATEPHQSNGLNADEAVEPEKLRYKQKYEKINPNLIIEFMSDFSAAQPLHVLFDWLQINSDILINCFATNPEFIDKIFDLLNLINIDIFTRKVYFDRRFIVTPDVREELRLLFDSRASIPLAEDVLLKEFHLFDHSQNHLDWTSASKLNTTAAEENILRVFRLVDFGFFVSKMRKFKYNFCSRTRKFVCDESAPVRKRQRKRGRNSHRRRRNRDRRGGGAQRSREQSRHRRTGGSSTEDHEDGERRNNGLRKGYLKNKTNLKANGVKPAAEKEPKKEKVGEMGGGNKPEIMGKLWLQHEIKTLEAKMSKAPMIVTPYLVVDTKAIVEHLPIVKNLVKAKQFVVLIPNAVLAEMDDLKKVTDQARIPSRWLEEEFTNGNRFIRLQRSNENLPISLIKIPKKLDRESLTFVQIAQFSHYMNENHGLKNGTGPEMRPNAVTILTGDKLADKKDSNLSCTGILKAAAINYEQITSFYAKYKKK